MAKFRFGSSCVGSDYGLDSGRVRFGQPRVSDSSYGSERERESRVVEVGGNRW
ncbi:hypothetical protein Hanom_Chr09g00788001 [Helianthus anomalus]